MILVKRPDGKSEVRPAWVGQTVVIIGGGPSLTYEQIGRVQAAHTFGEVRCIAVNSAYLLAPWADVSYFADSHWWKWHTMGTPVQTLGLSAEQVREKWAAFKGQKCTIENSGGNVTDPAVHVMRNRDFPIHGTGLSRDPQFLVTGRNSGFQSLNLATLAGVTTAILLGFDGKPAADGKTHFLGEHPRPCPPNAYPYYRAAMSAAERDLDDLGVTVLNASPGSAIDSFKKVRIEDVL